ncbi:MAG: LysR family transcriptional regulator [Gracilibacteraceae bacterium]|jgi:DNA-binding transcriptional LysR family regulator|nr:LysR family transcriptional regulator [Gracilibacteraceae bacterium]
MIEQEFLVFKAVAESSNISLAARHLHISQPAVSLQIQNMESYYGVKLLERSNKGVQLTAAGQTFYNYANEMLLRHEKLKDELSQLAECQREYVKIGATLTIGEYVVPNLLTYLFRVRPDIDFKVNIANTESVTQDLLERKLRIGLIEGPVRDHRDLAQEEFWQDELLVVTPFHHPWAAKGYVTLSELAAARLIMREEGSGTRKVVENIFHENGIRLSDMNIMMEVGNTQAIKQLVAAGLGVTIISALTVRQECLDQTLLGVKVQGLEMSRPFRLVTYKDHNLTKAELFFLDFLRSDNLAKVLHEEGGCLEEAETEWEK